MSKQIILIRHAQTAGKQAGQRDYDRPLTPEGEAQARAIGQYFVRNSVQPDILISSGAARAKQTALFLNESTRLSATQLVFLDSLYETDGDVWIAELRQLSESCKTVVCIGHNPTISWVAGELAQRPVDLAPAAFISFHSTALSWSAFEADIREIPRPK